jgi:hypothetical protein
MVLETDSDFGLWFLDPEDVFVVFIIVLFVVRHNGYRGVKATGGWKESGTR